MEQHHLCKFQVEVCRRHLSEGNRANTSAHVNLSHGFSDITGKSRHIGSRTVVIYCFICASCTLHKYVISNTFITCVISGAIDTILDAFLALSDRICVIYSAKVVNRAYGKTFNFIQRVRLGTIFTNRRLL